MKYKYIGTEAQLIENGFRPYHDTNYDCITSYHKPCKRVDNEIMVAWNNNCCFDKREIGYRYGFDNLNINDIQGLIDKG